MNSEKPKSVEGTSEGVRTLSQVAWRIGWCGVAALFATLILLLWQTPAEARPAPADGGSSNKPVATAPTTTPGQKVRPTENGGQAPAGVSITPTTANTQSTVKPVPGPARGALADDVADSAALTAAGSKTQSSVKPVTAPPVTAATTPSTTPKPPTTASAPPPAGVVPAGVSTAPTTTPGQKVRPTENGGQAPAGVSMTPTPAKTQSTVKPVPGPARGALADDVADSAALTAAGSSGRYPRPTENEGLAPAGVSLTPTRSIVKPVPGPARAVLADDVADSAALTVVKVPRQAVLADAAKQARAAVGTPADFDEPSFLDELVDDAGGAVNEVDDFVDGHQETIIKAAVVTATGVGVVAACVGTIAIGCAPAIIAGAGVVGATFATLDCPEGHSKVGCAGKGAVVGIVGGTASVVVPGSGLLAIAGSGAAAGFSSTLTSQAFEGDFKLRPVVVNTTAGFATAGAAKIGLAGVSKLVPRGTRVVTEAEGQSVASEVPGTRGAAGGVSPGNLPSVIYREGTPRPGNLTPRATDEGMLSFRDSLSNPWVPPAERPPTWRPVLRPGEPYIGIDPSRLRHDSVIPDKVPPGHVSVRDSVSVDEYLDALIERGKFPK